MPRRGYRKGISDDQDPKCKVMHTRVVQATFDTLHTEAANRGITTAHLIRTILEAHTAGKPVSLPHTSGLTEDFLRTFARLGNNLNQLARQANTGLVTVSASELRQALDELRRLAKTIVP